jgi:hypothetical protein
MRTLASRSGRLFGVRDCGLAKRQPKKSGRQYACRSDKSAGWEQQS